MSTISKVMDAVLTDCVSSLKYAVGIVGLGRDGHLQEIA
jgi:hypothetical protein